jgi:transcriptional regulator with XRE-family HTH domain
MDPERARAATIDGIVAHRLRAYRRALGVPACLLDAAIGSAFGTVERIEAGDRRATTAELYRLATVLGIEVGAFFEPPAADEPIVEPASSPTGGTSGDEPVAMEAQRFIKAFARLTDPVVRARVITLVRELAQPGPAAARSAEPKPDNAEP